MKSVILKHPDFLIYECTAVKGENLDFDRKEDALVTQLRSQTIFVEGEADVTRLSGEAGTNMITKRMAGESTYDKQPYAKIKAGKIRFNVITDTFRFFCLTPFSKKKHTGKTVRPHAGHIFIVPKGSYLFLASGSISVDINGNATPFNAPMMFNVDTQATTFTAVSDALCVAIPKDKDVFPKGSKAS
jgi:hypothetical protein